MPETTPVQRDTLIAMKALASYMYNKDGREFFLDVYGEGHTWDYMVEKAEIWSRSKVHAMGMLDAAHFVKLCEAAMNSNGEHSRIFFQAEGIL